MHAMHWIATYTKEITAVAATGNATEFSYRTAIDNMLHAAVTEFGLDARILQEPSRIKNSGAPDFRVSAKGGGVIGYVECKTPGDNLQKLTTKAQLEKYRALSGNILLTDSWHWLLLRDGKKIGHVVLTEKPDRKVKADFTNLLHTFMEAEAEKIGDAKRLAAALARRCAILRAGLKTHANDDPAQSRLHGLLEAFRTALDTELSFTKFADAFAQTLVYSLLLAKLKAPAGTKLDLYGINRHIPANFAVIREITTFLQGLNDSEYEDIAWVVDDILAIINTMDAAAVSESMSYRKDGKGFTDDDDPYIYFYEDFLAAYDAKLRERCGAYYTPPPVVKFIVRAADDVLRRDFGLANGLAETDAVTALDFAAGTGTFLLEMMRTVLSGAPPARRNMLTHGHVLKNFYGFELIMAPYVIAHLKLSQFLADNDVPLEQDERINIFLTNTLEPIGKQIELPMMPKLADEANRAQKVKDSPVLVITGNPPYQGISQNKSAEQYVREHKRIKNKQVKDTRPTWIGGLIETYKQVDGQHFGEKKHWLHDDYVKFIRFAQWKMAQVERGIVAIITNHAFLDNPTFRGMRQSLLNAFDALYFLDLHGNVQKKETDPGGSKDENVFDIMQGVAISILIKNPKAKQKGVFHTDLWGLREDKYRACIENGIETIKWRTLTPDSSPYLFVPRRNMPAEYKTAFSTKDIFSVNVSGIVTARDHFAIDTDKSALLQRMRRFINTDKNDSEIATELKLKDTRGWKITEARKNMARIENLDEYVKEIVYRPFDMRWIFYHSSAIDWGREKFMRHMLLEETFGLVTVRQVAEGIFNHTVAVDTVMDNRLTRSNRGIGYLFPLYRQDIEMGKTVRNENLTPEFRRWINDHYGTTHSPEAILGCIYAILHSPDYRKCYADFLRTDFPRIPFPEQNNEFKRLATIGKELIAAHLLRNHCTGDLAKHDGTGTSHQVEKVPTMKTPSASISTKEYFAPVPPDHLPNRRLSTPGQSRKSHLQ